MTDKKLTDSEIIKALEWCVSKFKNAGFVYMGVDGTKLVSTQEVLDLINRLQAENEELKETVKVLRVGVEQAHLIRKDGKSPFNLLKTEIKAEAYKECIEKAVDRVEKARQKYQRLCKEQGEEMDEAMNIHFNGVVNLLKELAGEDDG